MKMSCSCMSNVKSIISSTVKTPEPGNPIATKDMQLHKKGKLPDAGEVPD